MLEGDPISPAYQTVANKSAWVRAPSGGLLRFHVAPGAIVDEGDPIATVDNLMTGESRTQHAHLSGIVIGMPTFPAVKPGEPVCHIAVPNRSLADIRAEIELAPASLHRRFQRALAADVKIERPPGKT
jgi:predicted deacylase